MAAVATLGPVAVSIDAAAMGFKYFAGAAFLWEGGVEGMLVRLSFSRRGGTAGGRGDKQ